MTELGGTVNGITYVVPGSPRYANDERVLLFLETNDRGEWVSKNMAVGKFAFSDSHLVRDSSELFGWDVDTGESHREPLRDAERFLAYVRDVAAGRVAHADYIVSDRISAESLKPAPQAADPNTYLLQASDGRGLRWNLFPTPVTFLSHGSQPGAQNGGLTSMQRGFGAWSNASGANIRYQYGGITSVSQTGLISGCCADRVNTVQFNDPSNEIPGSFQLQGGATLAVGGAWNDGSTHQAFGDTFLTIVEADVVVQDGIDTGGGAVGLAGNGFDHVLTHELGHTLGLRHSDQPPPGGTSSTNAIMDSSVDFNDDTIGSNLQAWDLEAVDAVYGSGTVTPPPCNQPSITAQPQSVSIINTQANLNVTATGDAPLKFQWFIGTSGNTSQPIAGATAALLTVQPQSTTQYWVQVANKCGSVNSATVTVTVNGCPAVVINSLSLSATIIEGKSTTLTASAAGNGLTYQWFIGNPGTTTTPAGNSSTITVQPNVSTNYWVRVMNSCGASADSDVVVITVQPCNAPNIVVQPSGGDVLANSSVVLFVTDTATKPETYQWFEGAAGDTSKPVPGAAFPSFTTPALASPASYWVRIANDCGTIDSQAAQLNVVTSCRAPSIVSQPADQSVASGSSAILHLGVSGTSLQYQWYEGALLDFTRPVGGSSPSLMTPPITAPAQFWVHVTSPCGNVNSAAVTVSPAARRRPSRG